MTDLILIMTTYLFILFIGVCIGIYIDRISSAKGLEKKTNAGVFHINTTDPNKDLIQIELSIPIGDLITKKEVVFEVMDESQEIQPL